MILHATEYGAKGDPQASCNDVSLSSTGDTTMFAPTVESLAPKTINW